MSTAPTFTHAHLVFSEDFIHILVLASNVFRTIFCQDSGVRVRKGKALYAGKQNQKAI